MENLFSIPLSLMVKIAGGVVGVGIGARVLWWAGGRRSGQGGKRKSILGQGVVNTLFSYLYSSKFI